MSLNTDRTGNKKNINNTNELFDLSDPKFLPRDSLGQTTIYN